MTFGRFCKMMHPEHVDVQVSDGDVQSYEECKIHCCWKFDFGSLEKRSGVDGDLDAYDSDYEDPLECHIHNMLEAMPCAIGKTCWRGVCGEHNWTEIYNSSHTSRTFQTL
ncbi:uncharacterized protein LOC142563539 [Dermacentor variabilis]|uniref:uncharacterized protein LOC142563539 n=1 Tax=Dermacentor variabilis TaxID=34621 RepID=UPI003F5BC1DC